MRTLFKQVTLAAIGCTVALAATAGPVPSGLSISGQVSLDVANSSGPTGGGTQSGFFKHVSGGAATTASFSGNPGTLSPSTLSGSLTQTGDGFGSRLVIGGSTTTNASLTSGSLFVDYLLNLSNSSAFTYTVTFAGLWSNTVSATGATGLGAYAHADWVMQDAAFNELMATDHMVDTVNAGSNFSYDSIAHAFTVILAPGASAAFHGLQRIIGGTDVIGGYSGDLDAFLQLSSITGGRTGGGNVPLPASVPLVLLGLALLRLTSPRAPRSR